MGVLMAWRTFLKEGKTLDAQQFEQWITQHPSLVDDVDKGGWTALHFAVYFQQAKVVLGARKEHDHTNMLRHSALHLC